VDGDTVAVIGDNRRWLLFPIDQVPRDGARARRATAGEIQGRRLSDIATFDDQGWLTWKDSAGREFSATIKELADWRGNRPTPASAPKGFPKSNKSGAGRVGRKHADPAFRSHVRLGNRLEAFARRGEPRIEAGWRDFRRYSAHRIFRRHECALVRPVSQHENCTGTVQRGIVDIQMNLINLEIGCSAP